MILVTVSLFGGLLTIVVIATLLFLYRRPIKVVINYTDGEVHDDGDNTIEHVDDPNFPNLKKAWLHPSNSSPRHTSHGPTLYDAFVLYAPRDEVIIFLIYHDFHRKDCFILKIILDRDYFHHPFLQAFLQQVLLPGLDARGGSYRLCLQHR